MVSRARAASAVVSHTWSAVGCAIASVLRLHEFIFILSLQGRMHSKGKGIADSALPYKRTPPAWLKTPASEVSEKG